MTILPPVNGGELSLKQDTPLNIFVIGGSGFVGSLLIPVMVRRGHKVVLASKISRDISFLEAILQSNEEIKNADIVVLLSVVNNDIDAPLSKFKSVNVDLPLQLASLVGNFSGKRLILFGSDHANPNAIASYYAQSKNELQQRLIALEKSRVTLLILSPVYGARFVKRLAFVDRLPKLLRRLAVAAFGALRPLTHVERVADAIVSSAWSASMKTQIVRISDDQDGNPIYRAAVRIFDLSFAVMTLVLFLWLMLLLTVMIRVDSPGPALFKQQRVGRHGRIFTCYKFRTMQLGTKNTATHEASVVSITPIGRYLRAWKLDELPQVLNIFFNQMSLVGPRPCLPSQTELVEARSRLGVLNAKPGVTGLSQIRGIDMSEPMRLAQSDAEYCAKRSIPQYIRIVLLTFLGKGSGDRVR